MELNLSSQEDYFLKKHLFTSKTHTADGLILQVQQTYPNSAGDVRKYRFTYLSFNYLGTYLAVSDVKGHIFILNLELESYWQLPKVGIPTFISFPVLKKQELLIGLDNTSIIFVDIESGNVTGALHGHSAPANDVSYSDDGYYYLTSCDTEAIVWNSTSFVQIHRLSLKEDVYLKKVLFMPVTNHILACFQGDIIHVWKFGSFECIKRIVPEICNAHYIKTLAITKNGETMITAGQRSNLVIFCLDTWTVKNVVEFPDNISGVQQIEFLSQVFDGGANKILVVLTTSQDLFFFDIETLGFIKWIHQINGLAVKFSLSFNGKYLASTLATGEVNIYAVEAVLNKKLTHVEEEEFFNETPCNRVHSSSSSRRSQKSYESLTNIQKEIKEILDVKKLLPILKQFGEYPQTYRTLIWKTILQLPENQECFLSLTMKSCHPGYSKLELKYPLTNKSLCKSLKKLLSNLAHWCPLFGEVDFLPEFAFPFVKLFHSNPLICFEVVATVIVNWCQNWFEFYPFPPINLLSLLESILGYHDPALLEFYLKNNITSSITVCPLYHSAFSEVLAKSEWLKLWDHILSNEVSFFFMAIIAYNVVCQNAIRNLKDMSEIEAFFHTQNPVDMKMLISKTYQYLKETPEDIHTRQFFSPFRSLGAGGTYNKFIAYPKLIFDSGSEKLQSIRKEEDKILEEQFRALNIRNALEKKLTRENTVQEKEKIYEELEEKIRNTVEEEEDRLLAERQKLQNLRQELKLKELEVLESTRENALKKKIKQKEIEFERLLKDISKRKLRERFEIGTMEKEIRNYYSDLLLRKSQLEMELGLDNFESTHDGNLQEHREKLKKDLMELQYEWDNHYHGKRLDICNKITAIKGLLCDVETEIAKEIAQSNSEYYLEDDRVVVEELKSKVNLLEDEVEVLIKKNLENLRCKKDQKMSAGIQSLTKSEVLRKPSEPQQTKQVKSTRSIKSVKKGQPIKISKGLKDSINEKGSLELLEADPHFSSKTSSKFSSNFQPKSKFTCQTKAHFSGNSDDDVKFDVSPMKYHKHSKGDSPSQKNIPCKKTLKKKTKTPSILKMRQEQKYIPGDRCSSPDEIFKSTLRARSQIIQEAKRS